MRLATSEQANDVRVRGKIRRITDHTGSALELDFYDDSNLLRRAETASCLRTVAPWFLARSGSRRDVRRLSSCEPGALERVGSRSAETGSWPAPYAWDFANDDPLHCSEADDNTSAACLGVTRRRLPVPGGYRNAAEYSRVPRSRACSGWPPGRGTGRRTPIRSPASRLTCVAFVAAGAADCSIWS